MQETVKEGRGSRGPYQRSTTDLATKTGIDRCHACPAKVRFDTDGDGNLVALDVDTYKRHPHPIRIRLASEVAA